MNKNLVKPLVAAVGATVIGSLSSLVLAGTDQSPFGMTGLSDGYMVAFSSRKDEEAEGKCGEGKAEEGKAAEGSCGEGKEKATEGSCGEGKAAEEGKCGEKKPE